MVEPGGLHDRPFIPIETEPAQIGNCLLGRSRLDAGESISSMRNTNRPPRERTDNQASR